MSIPDLRQDGKVVVVTGSRRGLGKAMALAFAEAGADIVVSDVVTDDGELDNTVKEIQAFGRRVLATRTDVSKKNEIDDMVKQTKEKFGRIDVLINNAGITTSGSLLTATESEWEKAIGVNLKGLIFCSQAVGRVMMEQRSGVIINMSSMAGLGTAFNLYRMCKSTIISVTYGLAALLGPYNIRVNAIAPGIIKTEMTRTGWSNEENLIRINKTTPLGRIGEPMDVALSALLLASDAARFITGQTITVDGGYQVIR